MSAALHAEYNTSYRNRAAQSTGSQNSKIPNRLIRLENVFLDREPPFRAASMRGLLPPRK
eukprot:scaffold13424_cov73-Skeletonema_dohrnii-CCMP3373.AAC.1